MSSVKDIYKIIDEAAPFSTQMSFDNSGLLVGDPGMTVKKALICLDITRPVVREAKEKGCELILSHHPVIFNPARKVMSGTALYDLITGGFSAICSHTNLDVSLVCGVNRSLSDTLGLVNFTRDGSSECMFTAELPEVMNPADFLALLKEKLHAPYARVTSVDQNRKIKKIGFCSGSGGEFVFDAVSTCDAYLTGEAKHHELLFALENDFPMFTAGHYATERIFAGPFAEYLASQISDVEFIVSSSEKDPEII